MIRLEERNSVWKISQNRFNWTKRNKTPREESRHRLWIIFHVFWGSFNTCVLARSVPTGSCMDVRPFFGAQPCCNYQLSLHCCGWSLTAIFISSRLAANWLFSCFLSWPFRLSSLQPIRTHHRFAANTFLFLILASAEIPLISPVSYMFLSFPPSGGGPVNLAKNY